MPALPSFSVELADGGALFGGFTLSTALDVAEQTETGGDRRVVRITCAGRVILEGVSLRDALSPFLVSN